MVATLLYGTPVAAEIKRFIQQKTAQRISEGYSPPGLAVIQVGDNPASHIYVNHKRRACLDVGFQSFAYDLPISTTESELLQLIDTLNHAPDIHGILVQLPLPKHIRTSLVIEHIHPDKDVDGFHPYHLGRLAQGMPILRPCTPFGIITLLQHYQIDIAGMHAVVIGASNIVGRPMLLELLMAKATVTICHSKTRHLEQHVRHADLIVIATGTYDLIQSSWLHDKQIVVDVGIHRNQAGQIHGDLNFEEVRQKVAALTPVPGGVGPMTICMLLQNTLTAAVNIQSRLSQSNSLSNSPS